jgi:hypothetical protein
VATAKTTPTATTQKAMIFSGLMGGDFNGRHHSARHKAVNGVELRLPKKIRLNRAICP